MTLPQKLARDIENLGIDSRDYTLPSITRLFTWSNENKHLSLQFCAVIGCFGACVSQERRGHGLSILERLWKG